MPQGETLTLADWSKLLETKANAELATRFRVGARQRERIGPFEPEWVVTRRRRHKSRTSRLSGLVVFTLGLLAGWVLRTTF